MIATVVGLSGAAIAFWIGLWQYRRAQQWKRADLAAKEMTALLADTKAATALSMIDWASRNFRLKAINDKQSTEETRVTIEDQWIALLPHTFAQPQRSFDQRAMQSSGAEDRERFANVDACASVENTEVPVAGDGAQFREYNEKETVIRDCYDSLLDRLDRLGSYLHTRLLTLEDMRPYIGYYINDIASPAKSPAEAIWSVALLTYVYFYHFDSVPVLFKEFGHDILPDGDQFKAYVTAAGERTQIARQLQDVARTESQSANRLLQGR